jgi:hypothetical protein
VTCAVDPFTTFEATSGGISEMQALARALERPPRALAPYAAERGNSMQRSLKAYLRTLPDDELLDLRRRAAAEIANRRAHELRMRDKTRREWAEIAKRAGLTEAELSTLFDD